mmetsp:Transcript_19009/g.53612  ORF Transcript_19009/g.53612 Transcript_19009/m.53612 type:complete len:132 (+) Transcript_19009:3-398(+)
MEFDIAQKKVHGCRLLEDLQRNPESRARCISGYSHFNQEVMTAVPPEQLLVFNVKEGWGPLCRFLGMPVPDKPFPRGDAVRERKLWVPRGGDNEEVQSTLGLLFWLVLLSCVCCRCCTRRWWAAASSKKES